MFGRLQVIIVGGIILFGLLTGLYYNWRKGIEREALLEYNQKQIEQYQKDQEEFKAKMKKIEDDQIALIAKNNEDKKIFESKMNATSEFLNSNDAKKLDRPSSEILKKTIDKLKDAPK